MRFGVIHPETGGPAVDLGCGSFAALPLAPAVPFTPPSGGGMSQAASDAADDGDLD